MARTPPPEPPGMAPLPPATRAAPPTFGPAHAAVYRDAMRALDEAALPWLVGGAVAVQAHTGVWRDTKDLDVFCRPEDATRILATLEAQGFETCVVHAPWLGKAWKGEPFVDVIWRNANGLFPVDDDWLRRGVDADVLGHPARALGAEDLLLSKLMVCGRNRFDGADILHLLYRAGPRIDWALLERLAGEHLALLLGHLHVYRWAYPAWRDHVPPAVLARYARLAETRESLHGPFRGRLLDLPSFEVDVTAWGLPDPHERVLQALPPGGPA